MSFSCSCTYIRRLNFRLYIYILCLLLPFILIPLANSPEKESRCGYIIILVAAYWMLEPVHLAATSLLPVVLCPLLGIVSSTEICTNYMKDTSMMFIGGLIVAISIEDCRLHERIALKVLVLVGAELKWLMFGFMVTTMFLSMWISNTATAAMMVPIVEAVILEISADEDVSGKELELMEISDKSQTENNEKSIVPDAITSKANGTSRNSQLNRHLSVIKIALLLSICYSANIGGTGTLTGTGPNLVLKGMLEELHPNSDEITFATWMMYNVPGMVICVIIAWIYLYIVYIRCSKSSAIVMSNKNITGAISKRYSDLGSITFHESAVLALFIVLVILWTFRDPKFVSGWAKAMGSDVKIGDSVPAIAICTLLFLVPSNPRDFSSKPLLTWQSVQAKLPWGVILLTGGGFALADAAQKSGLSVLIGKKLSSLAVLSPGAIAAVICFMTAMITEILTNTTAANILLPVFNQMAISSGINPLFLMLPVAVTCSYAFMLPVATPPNAIAFESGHMKTLDMVKPGLVMNLICCAVQLFMINTLGVVMFDLNTFPSWINVNQSIQNERFNNNSVLNASIVNIFSNDTVMTHT